MGLAVNKTKRGKGTRIMAIADAVGFPVAAQIESASPHAVELVETTIDSGFTEHVPERLIGIKLTTVTALMINCLKNRELS